MLDVECCEKNAERMPLFPLVMTKWKKRQVYFLPARQILEKKVSANKELQVMEQY